MTCSRTRHTYMVCIRIIDAKFASKPLCKRLETTAQDSHLETQRFQRLAKFAGARGDGQYGLQLLENVSGHAFQQSNTRF